MVHGLYVLLIALAAKVTTTASFRSASINTLVTDLS